MKVSARNNNKKVIAKKPLTNLYEMNSRFQTDLFVGLMKQWIIWCTYILRDFNG